MTTLGVVVLRRRDRRHRAELGRHRRADRPRAAARCPCPRLNTSWRTLDYDDPPLDRRPQRRPAPHARGRAHVVHRRLRHVRPRRLLRAARRPGRRRAQRQGQRHPGRRRVLVHQQPHGGRPRRATPATRSCTSSATRSACTTRSTTRSASAAASCGGAATRPATAVRSPPRTRPGTPRSSRSDGNTRPGLGPISHRRRRGLGRRPPLRPRRRERPRPLRPGRGVGADGLLQRRRRAVPLVVGLRARPADRGHPRTCAGSGGGGGGGGGSWETGEIDTQADVVVPPAGSRGVLISGTISAADKSALIESALPLPYPGDAATGCGAYTAARRGRRGRRARTASLHAVGALRRRRGRRSDRSRSPRPSRSRRPPRSARSVVISDSDGALVTRTAATGAAPTAGDVAISDPSIEQDPVTLTWKRSAGSTSAIFFSPDDGVVVAPAGVPRHGRVVRRSTPRRWPAPARAASRSRPPTGCAARSRSSPASPSACPTPRRRSRSRRRVPTIPSPSGLQPIVFSALAGDRDQELGDDAVVWTLRP